MRIAFYAPLKSPHHPVPSGDRLMARLLMRALSLAGHAVDLASELRARAPSPEGHGPIAQRAADEVARLNEEWRRGPAPDLFFCYHTYYKAPDFVGPPLAAALGIPYVTAEGSMSPRRSTDEWAASEAVVRAAFKQAALSICFTQRDRDGALRIMPDLSTEMLPPFIDPSPTIRTSHPGPARIITVAMMRDGDKRESYRILAAALSLCLDLPWTLWVVGDGEIRNEIEAWCAPFSGRIAWLGEVRPEDVPGILASGDVYAWPGVGEAYGMAYLEAQAAGLPVVAQAVAGVPEVVLDGRTGLLSPAGEVDDIAASIRRLLSDTHLRETLGAHARDFVSQDRSLEAASARLRTILSRFGPK